MHTHPRILAASFAASVLLPGIPALGADSLEEVLLGNLLSPDQVEEYGIISQCHEYDGVCVSHAPWQSAEEIAAFVDVVAEPSETTRHNIVSRIQWTATDGDLTQFSRFTVTYSFAPDGTTVSGEGTVPGSTTGPSNMFSTMDAAFATLGGRAKWQSLIRESLERYERYAPIDFVEVTDDGAPFPGSFGSNEDGAIRGDLRFAMRPIDGVNGTRAYGRFPDVCEIVLDSADVATWTQTTANHRAMRNTVMHCIGHALGLQHVIPAPPTSGGTTKLMENALSLEFDGPQQDDILGILANYDDRFGNVGSIPEAGFLGTLRGDQTILAADLSLSRSGTAAQDFFAFEVEDAALSVTLVLSPVGSSYVVGPEGGTTANFNPLDRRNMNLALLSQARGENVIAQVDATAAGASEVLLRQDLSATGPGIYYARVGCTTANAPQRYQLMIYTDANNNNLPDEKDLARLEDAEGADNCADAMPIDQNVLYVGTTVGATSDGRSKCGTSNQSPDVWYEYTPGFAGTLDVSLCSSSYDTVLSVHRDCSEMEYISTACNDNSTLCSQTGKTSYIRGIAVQAGVRYLIRISGFSGAAGSYVLSLRGPDSYYGRSNDNDDSHTMDSVEDPIVMAEFPSFDPSFNYGELNPEMTPTPSLLDPANIPGYQGSAPSTTDEIGISSTGPLNPGFASWRRNLGFPMRFNTIYRATYTLGTDATPGSSNWVRTRLGGDFLEANGATDYGFVNDAAALPTGKGSRTVEAWHWSKNDSSGSSLAGQPDEPAFAFDLIDQSSTVGGHIAAISSLTIDAIDRADLGEPTILRNRGIANLTRQDGITPSTLNRAPFGADSGYRVGVVNDETSGVTMVNSFLVPLNGAMNISFATPVTGSQTGFGAVFVDPAVAPDEAYVTINPDRLYCMDLWISSQTSPNTTTQRPPVLRMRWTPEQVAFNQGQVSISSFNLNPDATWNGVYDNPSGLRLGGAAERYTSFWWPSLDVNAQPDTDYLYFIDFMYNRQGLSAIKPRGTYSIERLVVSEYAKPGI